MKRLSFLIGKWSGDASVYRGPGQTADLAQTEEACYKLVEIEGVGRTKADGKLALQALGLISFDDESGAYRMRAFNDGRWLESDVKLRDDGKSLTWGFSVGPVKTSSILRINEKGEWTEHTELTLGSAAPIIFMELAVHRVAEK